MRKLNLKAANDEQKKILAYLQENVSDVLAEKITNGVRIQKDSKTLINKKDLNTFAEYASKQALEYIAEKDRKGEKILCFDDSVVYGWAIHYFEEESIEGKLYNEDGTEYKPAKPVKQSTPPIHTTYTPPPPKPKPQLSIFDMLNAKQSEEKPPIEEATELAKQDNDNKLADNADTETEPTIDEIADTLQKAVEEKNGKSVEAKQVSPSYQAYTQLQAQYPDSIIAYRIGDFYEVLGEKAVILAEELDLTITGRDFGLPVRVPMIGFPYHAVNAYIRALTQRGYKIALAESTDQIVDCSTGLVLNTQTSKVEESKANDETIQNLSDLLGDIFIVR